MVTAVGAGAAERGRANRVVPRVEAVMVVVMEEDTEAMTVEAMAVVPVAEWVEAVAVATARRALMAEAAQQAAVAMAAAEPAGGDAAAATAMASVAGTAAELAAGKVAAAKVAGEAASKVDLLEGVPRCQSPSDTRSSCRWRSHEPWERMRGADWQRWARGQIPCIRRRNRRQTSRTAAN